MSKASNKTRLRFHNFWGRMRLRMRLRIRPRIRFRISFRIRFCLRLPSKVLPSKGLSSLAPKVNLSRLRDLFQ